MAGRKTTIDLDEELVSQARLILGTRGIKDTIDRALSEVIVADARRRTIEQLAALDVQAEALRREAWGE